MVRLVFRPYAQVRRTICTSVSLRASTRVSPGFTQLRYRSPSFGSNQLCSSTNIKSGRCCTFHNYCFHYACKVTPLTLAQLTNSLVRVSRRVVYKRIKQYTKRFGIPFVHCRTQRTATCTRFPLNDFKSVSSPFEVLFNFPSWYLFAIGLRVIFSH
jgi:hypothetical protein